MKGKEFVKCSDLPTKTPNLLMAKNQTDESGEDLTCWPPLPSPLFFLHLCMAVIIFMCVQVLAFTARVLDLEMAPGKCLRIQGQILFRQVVKRPKTGRGAPPSLWPGIPKSQPPNLGRIQTLLVTSQIAHSAAPTQLLLQFIYSWSHHLKPLLLSFPNLSLNQMPWSPGCFGAAIISPVLWVH